MDVLKSFGAIILATVIWTNFAYRVANMYLRCAPEILFLIYAAYATEK